MRNKVMILILTMMVVFSTLSGVGFGTGKAFAANEFSGNGTSSSPYLIGTADQLNQIRSAYLNKNLYFKLTKNIDLGTSSYKDNWSPIGDKSNTPFRGNFDGNGFVITGLTIDKMSSNLGLFGFTSNESSITNLMLEDVNVTGMNNVGGLVGANRGKISNSSVTGQVYGDEGTGGLVGNNGVTIYNPNAIINNCYAEVNVKGAYGAGGLIGENTGIISYSHATGEVKGDYAVGGLVGDNSGTISYSYATGKMIDGQSIGGLVGSNSTDGTISNSFAAGQVNGTFSTGGLTGYNYGAISKSYSTGEVNGYQHVGGLVSNLEGTISDSFTTGNVNGSSFVGGLIGYGYDSTGSFSYSYASGSVSGDYDTGDLTSNNEGNNIGSFYLDENMKGPVAGWDFDNLWAIDPSRNGGYPYLNDFLFDLKYDGNGSNSGTVPNDPTLYLPGETASIYTGALNLVKTGYTFMGWNTEANGKGKSYSGSFEVMPYTTLYAQWNAQITAATLTSGIGIVSEGGTASETITDIPYGTTLAVLKEEITPATNATFEIYEADGTTVATTLASGNKVIVTAADGITKITYTVTVIASSAKDITAFSLAEQTGAATINPTAHTVTIQVAGGTDVTSLKATFTLAPEASAQVANVDQVSGTTVNNFTTPLTYVVTAEDGSTQNWTVTVTKSSAKDFTSFSLAEQTGPATINTNNQSIDLEVAYGTILTGLKVIFTLSAEASAKIGSVNQVSGTTTNNFTLPITYVVKAADGSTQNWTVGVTAAYNSAKDITAFSLAAQTKAATINAATQTVAIEVKNGTDVNGLIATFTLSKDANAKVNGVSQTSKTTANDFTAPVTYVVRAENGTRQNWIVTVTVALSDAATLTSTIGTVSSGGTANESIMSIPNGTTLAALKTAITQAANATFEVYEADGITPATSLATGQKVIVTAQDGTTKVTYTVTVNAALSNAATLTSTIGTVSTGGTANESITSIPNGTTLATLKAAITQAVNATFEVYDADGTTLATTLATGKKVIVTAQDGTTKVTYTVTVNAALSNAATLTSAIGTVSTGGTASESIMNIPNGTTLAALKAAITQAANASFEVYEADGITLATTLATGQKIIVTAQDGTTKVTYTLTVNAATPSGGGGSMTPSDTKVSSTDGMLTLQAAKAGEVSLDNEIVVSIPANATDKELRVTIDKVTDSQELPLSNDVLLSGVFEIKKNFPENFTNPVTITVTFDASRLKKNQRAAVFYYGEANKVWVEVSGGKVNGNQIAVMVNHFGEFAVFAVDQVADVPTKDPSTDKVELIKFSDVTGHWAEANIMRAVNAGIVSGYPDGTFKPSHTVTRAEFAVMLMNMLKPQGEGAALAFTDTVKIGAWAQTAVAQAVQAGIIKGYEDGTFRPDAIITRAEMAVMLANALGQFIEANVLTDFSDDKEIPAWAKDNVAFLKQQGMVQGKGDNKFAPQAYAARAEAVTVLLNALAHRSK
jgi:uncharacterized repeat protein (TIGR02543 family)